MTIDKLGISGRIDSAGMSCPMPIVKTALAMAALQTGQLLEVVAYQAKSVGEFTAWGRSTGNSLVESSVESGVYRFVFRKT